jgi:hypothetical protein
LSANYWDNGLWDAALWDGEDPPVVETLLGGHFGFDEEKRTKQWEDERKVETKESKNLKKSYLGCPKKKEKSLLHQR